MASTEPTDDLAALEFFAELATAMIRSGESIDLVKDRLDGVAGVLELNDLEMLILPTVLLVQYGPTEDRNMRMVTAIGPNLRLDQVAAVYQLADDTITDGITVVEGQSRLDRILDSAPIYGPVLRTSGLGVLSVGFALSLQPTPFGVAVAFILGIVVGLMQLIAVRELRAAVPVIASFVVAAGQMISGAGRLVSGMVTLLLVAMASSPGPPWLGRRRSTSSIDPLRRRERGRPGWRSW